MIVDASGWSNRDAARAGVTLAVYSQYAYDREKREALDLWAARLVAIVGDSSRGRSRIPTDCVMRSDVSRDAIDAFNAVIPSF
jgi:hypothetical protein